MIHNDERRKAGEALETVLLQGLRSKESPFTPDDWKAIHNEAVAPQAGKAADLMPWITVREEARRDLIDHYVYLAENASARSHSARSEPFAPGIRIKPTFARTRPPAR